MPMTEIPDKDLAVVVTYFEMNSRPSLIPSEHIQLTIWQNPNISEYRQLFKQVGQEWLWFGRLLLSDDDLHSAINDPNITIFHIIFQGRKIGFVELDFSQTGQCEILYFGIIPEMNGKRLGREIMSETLAHAWRTDIERVWLHTCTNDSPRAPSFYQKVGFTAYKRATDTHPDPRLTGILPKSAAPHVPLIGTAS